MIGDLLPSSVSSCEAFRDEPGEPPFPGEEQVIARAVEERRREFVTARRCAREALARIGVPPVAILPGVRRAPQWPAGVVGSITHCTGYRAAAVARATRLAALGIDAEPHEPLPEGVFATVSVPAERPHLAELARRAPGTHWERLLFTAKESVFKAWYPLTGRELGFEEAALTFGPDGTFTAEVLAPDPVLRGFSGRWRVSRGLVLTAVVVRPDALRR
ncbi:4'-phosphopantetheinyl transferase superfamily protein [Actinoplanes sp. NPDC051633]|uniref:4'-phosphopantetheinyl transferase family protein n=1 Tax=Actinoplanes sp. NPDC051633 TaxID=3155670 RepID=UPI00342D73A3